MVWRAWKLVSSCMCNHELYIALSPRSMWLSVDNCLLLWLCLEMSGLPGPRMLGAAGTPQQGGRVGARASPTIPARSGAGLRAAGAAPAPGIRHHSWVWGWAETGPPGGLTGGPTPGQGRAVGSWTPALLRHRWGRDWWTRWTEMGSWALGRSAVPWWGAAQGIWVSSEPWWKELWGRGINIMKHGNSSLAKNQDTIQKHL